MTKNIKYQISNIKNTNQILNILRFNSSKLILCIVILLGVFLRFYNLEFVPPSASLDEVSIGWNGYSIIKTGGDEYGNRFPLLLRAYDDWRPALYAYLVAPFVAIFDLNVVSVRLPSVILSVLTVIAIYFLVKEIFSFHLGGAHSGHPRGGRMDSSGVERIEWLALFSAFLLSISPWHIYISRLGHEANLAFALFIFGVLFFLKKKITVSFIFFALSFVSYQAEKIFLPIFLIGLFFIFRKELLVIKKEVIIGTIIAFISILPFLIETLQPNALIRLSATSIFNHQNERYEKQANLFARAVENNDFVGKIIYNRRLVPVQTFTEGYMSHFNPAWLFANPSSDRHKVPNLGLLYLFEAPLILIGLVYLFSRKFNKKIRLLILLWTAASPLPGALTTDAPHAMRAYTMLPVPQILAALGAAVLVSGISNIKYKISKIQIKYFIFAMYILFFIFNFLLFLINYFLVFPKEQSASFQLALARAIPFVLENEGKYNKIIFSNQDNLYQSYMFFLFNSRYDPHLYQREGGTISGGFEETHTFGKYEFRPIDWDKEEKNSNILYVGNVDDFPRELESVKTCRYLDGETGVKIVKGS